MTLGGAQSVVESSESHIKKGNKKMKKLMIAAAAAAMIGGASAIESANIVGYQTKSATCEGYTAIAPPFITIGGDGARLGDIKGEIPDGDSIQIFNAEGDVEVELFWCEQGVSTFGETGWYYDDCETPAADFVIDQGKQFWYNAAAGEDVDLVMSGAVKDEPSTLDINGDGCYTAIGNGTPVALALEQFEFDGVEDGDSVQIFDPYGDVETEIFWCEQGVSTFGETGWYYDDCETYAGKVEINSGDGFWTCFQSGGTVEIPSAIVK